MADQAGELGPSRDMIEGFDARYRVSDEPVIQRIERQVTGAAFGSTSYTTRAQADHLGAILGLRPGRHLLDIGCGAGWPGIYLASTFECEVMLTDVPFEGVHKAATRLQEDELPGFALAATGSRLPFRASSFDAISSSDVFC